MELYEAKPYKYCTQNMPFKMICKQEYFLLKKRVNNAYKNKRKKFQKSSFNYNMFLNKTFNH